MTAAPVRRLELGPIVPGDDLAVARVLGEAFSTDDSLRQQVQLQPAQMRRFWELQVSLFQVQGPTREKSEVVTARENGRYVAAAVVYEEGWRPDGDVLTAHLDQYRKAFGLRALARYLRFSAEFSFKSTPSGPCVRLQSLGVADGERGRGLGATFLEFIHRTAAARGHPVVQLEVRATNPARTLYERSGYAYADHITVCGVEMEVMLKILVRGSLST